MSTKGIPTICAIGEKSRTGSKESCFFMFGSIVMMPLLAASSV